MVKLSFYVQVKQIHLEAIFPVLADTARGCANDLKAMEQAVVGNWKEKPTFTVQERTEGYHYEAEVVPTGNITHWRWVSRGTAGKTFGPKTAPALVFPFQGTGNSYVPKTSPGLFYGGPGKKVGPLRKFSKVNWPGIKPRMFEESLMAKYKPTFQARMNAALNQAMTKVAATTGG